MNKDVGAQLSVVEFKVDRIELRKLTFFEDLYNYQAELDNKKKRVLQNFMIS